MHLSPALINPSHMRFCRIGVYHTCYPLALSFDGNAAWSHGWWMLSADVDLVRALFFCTRMVTTPDAGAAYVLHHSLRLLRLPIQCPTSTSGKAEWQVQTKSVTVSHERVG